jgi:hypothetical protein
MPKFGDSNARAAKKPGAPKSIHRKGASAADDRGARKPRAAKTGAPSSRWEDRAPRTFDRDARPARDSRDSRDSNFMRGNTDPGHARRWWQNVPRPETDRTDPSPGRPTHAGVQKRT